MKSALPAQFMKRTTITNGRQIGFIHNFSNQPFHYNLNTTLNLEELD